MKFRTLFFLIALILASLASNAYAANHFVRAGASGTGSDWANACPDLAGSCAPTVRGDTYYVASGSYASRTFNAPASGTTLITIKGATAADHGTDTGWSSSYGVDVSQAKFTGSLRFSTSYWLFDGNVGPVWSRTPSQYGFLMPSVQYPVYIVNDSLVVTDVSVIHVAAIAPSGDVEKFFVSTDNVNPGVSRITLSNLYLSGWQNAYWATSPGKTMDSWVFQYCLCTNAFSSSTHHGEWINNNGGYHTNQVTRWNWFEGQQDGTGVVVANNNDNVNAKIYGNVFYNISEGNGIVTGTSAGNLVSPLVYNNTFINCSSGGWIGSNVTGTPVVQNNLIYNMSAGKGASGDYNAYFKTTNAPSEAHGQVSTIDPFVQSSGAGNLHLSVQTSAGISLPAPYNVDVDGNVRGSNGVWSRGAFQFGGVPPAPTPLAITTNALPAGTVGVPYAATLAQSGGVAPYSWSATGLPSGLSLSGNSISGTPTVDGTSSVSVSVSSSDSQTAGPSALSLVVAVAPPPPPPSTTITLGNTTTGNITDTADSNAPMLSRFVSGAVGGTAQTISVYVVSPLGTAPNNQFQVAIYSDSANKPANRLAASASGTLVANAWNTIAIPAIAISPNTAYWLAYNANGTSASQDDLRLSNGGTSCWKAPTAFGTWPNPLGSTSGCSANTISEYLTYSTVSPSVPAVAISIAPPASSTLQLGQTKQFTATVSNTANVGVNWSLNAPNGLFTAIALGSFTVTATSVADATQSASAIVTVTAPPPSLSLSCSGLVCTLAPANIPTGTPISISASGSGVQATATTTVP